MDLKKKNEIMRRFADRVVFEKNQLDIAKAMAITNMRTNGADEQELRDFEQSCARTVVDTFTR